MDPEESSSSQRNNNKRLDVVADRFKTRLCCKWLTSGLCPYDTRCMFAHGEQELRTMQMNVRDGLVTEESVWKYKKATSTPEGVLLPPPPPPPPPHQQSAMFSVPQQVPAYPPMPAASVFPVPPPNRPFQPHPQQQQHNLFPLSGETLVAVPMRPYPATGGFVLEQPPQVWPTPTPSQTMRQPTQLHAPPPPAMSNSLHPHQARPPPNQ